MNTKICEMVTDRILEMMSNGSIPWQKPWAMMSGAVSHTTGKPYSFLNQFLLGGFGEFITFNQCKAEGGKVKKGAKSKPVVFWKQMRVEETDPDTNEIKVKYIPVLKYYNVFDINDCEGIKRKYDPFVNPINNDPIEAAQMIVEAWKENGCRIFDNEYTDRAYYSPSADEIHVPNINQYEHVEEFYSTTFHEMTHSTGHKSRLDRFRGSAKNAAFGSEDYGREELVAEIGAAALVNFCGIETKNSFKNSAAYIQNWSDAIRNDSTMFIVAAGKAQKAFEMITKAAGFAEADEAEEE